MKFILALLIISAATAIPQIFIAKGHNNLCSGIDPLNYEVKNSICQLTYADQQLNIDHDGLRPDHVKETNHPAVDVDFSSEMFSANKNSSSQSNFHVDMEAGYAKIISGSFSYDNNYLHRQWSNKFHRVLVTKAKIWTSTVTLQLDEMELTRGLNDSVTRMAAAATHQTNVSIGRAIWEGERLVRIYGFNIIYRIDSGAELTLQSTVDINQYGDYSERELKTSAGVHFNYVFSLDAKVSTDRKSTSYQNYNRSVTDTRIIANGGDPWRQGQSYNDWLKTVRQNPAVIAVYSVDLLDFITDRTFPHLSMYEIQFVRDILESVIDKHIQDNTHRGCMDPYAADFNPRANVPDEASCRFDRKFNFGGVYQESSCSQYQVVNELTQAFSCPENFTSYPIVKNYNLGHDWTTIRNQRCCHSCWLVATCCKDCPQTVSHHETCSVSAHMCLAPKDHPVPKGMAFGGIHTANKANALTGTVGCPNGFQMVKFPLNWSKSQYFAVCYAPFDSAASDAGVHFGGLFSSSEENPMTGHYYCPKGFERHTYPLPNGESLYECIGMNDLNVWQEFVPAGFGSPEPSFVEGYPIANNTFVLLNVTSRVSYEEQFATLQASAEAAGHVEKEFLPDPNFLKKGFAAKNGSETWKKVLAYLGVILSILCLSFCVILAIMRVTRRNKYQGLADSNTETQMRRPARDTTHLI